MKTTTALILITILLFTLNSCEKETRNILGEPEQVNIDTGTTTAPPIRVNPTDINVQGFDLLQKMQGHWVGTNLVIADQYDWFSFDYRAISPSHIHGIFEGGSIGNLLTSFFVTDFKNTRTIMARNGGLLNGIYRTSYFVLDSVSNSATNGDFYRLVDAIGGINTMWMELRFKDDSLFFNAYTSRLGLFYPPTRHMTFKAKKEHLSLSQAAATAVNFPQKIPARDFSSGFNTNHIYINPGDESPKSATFLDQNSNADVYSLALSSADPFRIDQHPYLASLQIDVTRNANIIGKNLYVYLSMNSLTDAYGYFQLNEFNTVLLFPELSSNQDQFLVTYLHPGDYYITVIADANDDGSISQGDITHVSQPITITPQGQQQITITNITVQN